MKITNLKNYTLNEKNYTLNEIFTETPEKEYIKNFSHEYRKKLGQFFTPMLIADLMSEWVINNESGKNILDPALGLGVFFRSVAKNHLDIIKNFKFTGYEIDKNLISFASNLLKKIPKMNIHVNDKDYLTNDWEERYDGIICNPPYLKFHDYEPKDILLNIFKKIMKLKLSGFTNIYTLFILKSIFQLKEGGRIAYIVPSEFLNSDYGKNVKKYIKESNTLRFVIIVDFNFNVFEDVITTSCILLFAKDKHNYEVEFINIKNLNELKLIKNYILSYPVLKKKGKVIKINEKVIKINELDEAQKWRIYYQELNGNKYKHLVPFSKYAKISRGVATGANDYFMFSESKRNQYKIKQEFLLPCLAKASYATKHFLLMRNLKN